MRRVERWLLMLGLLGCCVRDAAAVPVADVEGECRTFQADVQSAVCGTVLEPGEQVFVPTHAVLEDGSRLPFSEAWAEAFAESMASQIASYKRFFSDGCWQETMLYLCGVAFRPCTTVQVRERELAVPVIPCKSVCETMWGACPKVYDMARDLAPKRVPGCNYDDDGEWGVMEPNYGDHVALLGGTTTAVPRNFRGVAEFAAEQNYTINFDDEPISFECAMRTALPLHSDPGPDGGQDPGDGGGGGGGGEDYALELCVSAGARCPNKVKYFSEAKQCDMCGLACPMVMFGTEPGDFEAELARLERNLAGVSLILLALLTLVEFLDWRRTKTRPNIFMAISNVTAIVSCVLTVALVRPGQNGCNDAGVFTDRNPDFWDEPGSQYTTCAIMSGSIHVLQVLINSMLCFLVEMYTGFRSAVHFARPLSQANKVGLFVSLAIVVPTLSSMLSFVYGREDFDDVLDPRFHFELARSGHRCGPIFKNPTLEVLVLRMPIATALLCCSFISFKLYRLCRKTQRARVTSANSSGRPKPLSRQGARARFVTTTAAVARQMLVFSFLALCIVALQIVSEVFIRSQMARFAKVQLRRDLCLALDGGRDGACDDADKDLKHAGGHGVMVKVHAACVNAIPLLFAALFLFAALNKQRPRSKLAARVSIAIPKTVIPSSARSSRSPRARAVATIVRTIGKGDIWSSSPRTVSPVQQVSPRSSPLPLSQQSPKASK